MRNPLAFLIILLITVFFVAFTAKLASAWSNGGYSTDPTNPTYGTHDWIAQHALDWLPPTEKQWILDNLNLYLYGTELPDSNQAPDGIGDTVKHHFYYYANGTIQDNASAVRATQEYQNALNFLNAKDYANASKSAGTMTHYLADLAVWAHVMAASTDWGAETGNNHSNYENYVNGRTSNYTDEYDKYLSFDGTLTLISAYDVAKNLANNTTFDNGLIYTCVWMNNNYNVSNPVYWVRAGESLNLAVNTVADVLHTLYTEANQPLIPEYPAPYALLTLLILATVALCLTKKQGRQRAT